MRCDYLKGIRVVDLTTYVAAPAAGRMLADWGADVIKVEDFRGDPMRKFGDQMGVPAAEDENPIWELENGNKRGVTIDLKHPEGRKIMRRLLATADIFISNVRLASLKKLGLDYESLSAEFPGLVWGHISGYGTLGPEAARPGYDVVSFWSRSGMLVDMPPVGHPPVTAPYGVGDHIAGLVLLGGVLGALRRAGKSGQGGKVEVSLYGTAIWVNGLMVISTQYGDQWPKDRYLPSSPLANTYKCSDGEWITLTILDFERYWKAFCQALELTDIIDDPRFSTLLAAKEPDNSRTLCRIIEDAFLKRESSVWAERLNAADIAFERAGHYHEAASDKQAIANHYVEPYTNANGSRFMLPVSPVRFDDNAASCQTPAPGLGQHNVQVLASLGYSREEIDGFRAAGAIG